MLLDKEDSDVRLANDVIRVTDEAIEKKMY